MLRLPGHNLHNAAHRLDHLTIGANTKCDEKLEGAEPLDAVLAVVLRVQADEFEGLGLESHAAALGIREQARLDDGQDVGSRHGAEDGRHGGGGGGDGWAVRRGGGVGGQRGRARDGRFRGRRGGRRDGDTREDENSGEERGEEVLCFLGLFGVFIAC